jgi:ribonuclease D
MISDTQGLEKICQAAQDAGAVGIDTEFVWNRTFYPSLGLVQVGYPDGETALIDAPKIEDWSPFAALMVDKGTVKILHDAQQDLTILQRACGETPRNVFDTQRSAGFVGMSSTISLRDVLKQLLRVRLAKTETQSDWLARPLTDAQLEYAEDDVRNSVRLMECILEKADVLGRREWITNEMRYYEQASLYEEQDPDVIMPRVRGSGALTHQQRNVLRSLGAWREKSARRRNIPRNFVLSDDALVSLLRKTPSSADDLRPIKGLSERTLERNRTQIWQAIERGMAGDLPELINHNTSTTNPDDGYEARVDFALAFLKGVCLAQKLDPALVGNRAEITALVLDADEPTLEDHRLLVGWRAKFCGNALLELLQGRRQLVIDPETKLPKQV